MNQPIRTQIRADAYFKLPEYADSDLIQLIDGEVVIGMPPILKHQAIVGEIFALLRLIARQWSGKAFTSPVEVYFDEHNVFEPDVIYIAPDNLEIAEKDEKRIIGAPDLVVEVLSPSTAKVDRHHKYQAYEKHGVREYWIVDPVHETIEVWVLTEGDYKLRGAFVDSDTFDSTVLTQTVDVSPLFDV